MLWLYQVHIFVDSAVCVCVVIVFCRWCSGPEEERFFIDRGGCLECDSRCVFVCRCNLLAGGICLFDFLTLNCTLVYAVTPFQLAGIVLFVSVLLFDWLQL